jgi:diamine N-acetyltransferase
MRAASHAQKEPDMAVRPATAADAPVIAALNADVHRLHHEVAPQWFKPPDQAAAEEYFGALLASEAFQAFIVEVDGRPLGYALARTREVPETPLTYGSRVVELDQITVDPSSRGQGLGRELIDAVRTFAAASEASRLQLTVWEFNARARRVFERAGFGAVTIRMVADV